MTHTRVAFAFVLAVALIACKGSADTADPAPQSEAEPTEESGSEESREENCALTTGTALIETVELSSADGNCKLFLPAGAAAGEYTVRISAAGSTDSAAVELAGGAERLFANEGTVTLESAEGGHFVGVIDAQDSNPPGTGAIYGRFDITIQ